jgi:hypothetical protein
MSKLPFSKNYQSWARKKKAEELFKCKGDEM